VFLRDDRDISVLTIFGSGTHRNLNTPSPGRLGIGVKNNWQERKERKRGPWTLR